MGYKNKPKEIQETKNCNFDWCDGKCYWVIMRDDGKAIFKHPHKSKDSALAEIKFESLSGYHIEHKSSKSSQVEKV